MNSLFTASHTNWSTPSSVTSSVVLSDEGKHGLASVMFARVMLHTMSSCARLDEFRFAGPEVHVVNTLANEAVQFRRGLRYAHGLYRLHSSMLV